MAGPGDRKPDDPERKAPAAKRPARDPGSETSGDTKMVNALESDPNFFKDPLVGKTLGKCRIEKFLGEGQTSIVYQARFEPLAKTVAVKVLQQHMTKFPAVVKVFQNEARAVAALDHENVLKIYDVGEDQGSHFLVLELLRGQDLQKIMEAKKRLPVEEALEYVRQAAAGLAAAHRKNIVHRDIKPHNLVLEPSGTLKIVDFGLAAEAEGAYSGGRLGTPHYMSPEQCRGELAKAESDVYALGITLYHLLAGHPPFAGKQTKEEIIAEHLKGRRLEVEKVRPDVPRAVADLIRRMTRMESSARPSAAEVVEQIGKLVHGEKAGGARGPRASRRGRARSSNAAPIVAGAGILVLLVILFVVMSKGGEEPASPSVATQPPPEPAPPVAPSKPSVPAAPAEPETVVQARELYAQAEKAEKADELTLAQSLYARVAQLSDPASDLYKRAKAASDELKKVIEARKRGERKPFVSSRDSEDVGEEYDRRRAEIDGLVGRLRLQEAKGELERLEGRTRPMTPERDKINAALERIGLIEKLLGMAQGRAHSLSGGRERWVRYDLGGTGDTIVLSADAAGVKLKNEITGTEDLRKWTEIPSLTLVPFFEAMRNEKSAKETLWLAYFCRLTGHESADTYFDRVLLLDDSAEMKAQVAELRK